MRVSFALPRSFHRLSFWLPLSATSMHLRQKFVTAGFSSVLPMWTEHSPEVLEWEVSFSVAVVHERTVLKHQGTVLDCDDFPLLEVRTAMCSGSKHKISNIPRHHSVPGRRYMYIFMYMEVYDIIYVYVCMYVCMYVCVCMYMCIYIYPHTYIYIYVPIQIDKYIYVHIYIYIEVVARRATTAPAVDCY